MGRYTGRSRGLAPEDLFVASICAVSTGSDERLVMPISIEVKDVMNLGCGMILFSILCRWVRLTPCC